MWYQIKLFQCVFNIYGIKLYEKLDLSGPFKKNLPSNCIMITYVNESSALKKFVNDK